MVAQSRLLIRAVGQSDQQYLPSSPRIAFGWHTTAPAPPSAVYARSRPGVCPRMTVACARGRFKYSAQGLVTWDLSRGVLSSDLVPVITCQVGTTRGRHVRESGAGLGWGGVVGGSRLVRVWWLAGGGGTFGTSVPQPFSWWEQSCTRWQPLVKRLHASDGLLSVLCPH